MKLKELKELTSQDLIQREKTIKKDLFALGYQRRMGTVEKPGFFKNYRKEIARIQTILRERDIEDERDSKKK